MSMRLGALAALAWGAADQVSELYSEPGMRAEGLAYDPKTSQLFFTDGNCPTHPPLDSVKAWAPATGVATVRAPSGHGNGQLLVGQALLTAETTGRRIAWSAVGSSAVETLVDSAADGSRLNSPNDMAFREADSSLWFTDPSYGCGQFHLACENAAFNSLYRMDLRSDGTPLSRPTRVRRVPLDFTRPNGLAFSPDERTLYVVDSGAILSVPETFSLDRPHNVTAFDVDGDALSNARLFAVIPPGSQYGIPDGLKVDAQGRVFVAMGDGVMVFDKDGQQLDHVVIGGQCSNLALGRGELFVGCGERLLALAADVAPRVAVADRGDGFWAAAGAPAEASAAAGALRGAEAPVQLVGLAPETLGERLQHGMATTGFLFSFGLFLRASGFMDASHAQGVCRMLVYASVPSLLVTTFWTADLTLGFWLSCTASAVLMYAFAFGLAPALWLFRNAPGELKGISLVLSMGWNIGMVGFPIVNLLLGPQDMPYIALFDVPNVCINFALSYIIASAYSPSKGEYVLMGEKRNRVCQVCLSDATRDLILGKILRFPPLLSAFVGLALSAVGPSPDTVPWFFGSLQQVASTTTPLALLCMGVLTDPSVLTLERLRQIQNVILIRTVPIACVIAAAVCYDAALLQAEGVRAMLFGLLMPAPLIAIPYAHEFGYDSAFTSAAVVVSTLWSFLLVGAYASVQAVLL